ncbi:HAD-IA family hydrolase [Dermatophilaceae bacterium Sec6.4]
MSAVLFGSISTIADTSELQREAFNKAFVAHDVNWVWDRSDYLAMLDKSGGRDRIAAYAQSRGESVDADAIHRTKSEIFQRDLAESNIVPRDDVAQTIQDAVDAGMSVGLVTTTSRRNISAMLDALHPQIRVDQFDIIVDVTDVDQRKPAGDAYEFALTSLHVKSDDCVAIEDNIEGVRAAQAAGITCVAFPNANTSGQDFAAADRRVHQVQFDELASLITAN